MKNLIFLFVCLLLICFSNILVAQERATTENTINVLSTPDLFNLTNDWASEYCKLNPNVKIKVNRLSEANLAGVSKVGDNLYFVSYDTYATLNDKQLWKVKVGKDVLVPIINSENPFLSDMKKQNISPEILAQILTNPVKRNWYVFPKTAKSVPVNYYKVTEQSENSMIAKFLSTKRSIEGTIVENYEKMISAIQNDPYSIGFCRLSSLMKSNNQSIDKCITLMPVDRNGNGKIDDFENVYSDLQTFKGTAWIEKFPVALTGNIYSIASQIPTNQAELDFLKWISSDGQNYLNQKGYSSLVYEEKLSNFKILGYNKDYVNASADSSVFSKIANFFASISLSLYAFVSFILLLIVVFAVMIFSSKKDSIVELTSNSTSVFNEDSLIIPTGLFFDKTHTWAFMERNGMVKIGIDDFFQHITGPLTKVKMKNPGEIIKKGEPILSVIQNGKLLNINSPVSGIIIKQNEMLSTEPSVINQSPYSNGWVYMIETTNWLREIQFFIMADKYREWLKFEFTRLKEFLSITLSAKTPAFASVILQDGGIIKDNVLADLGPEVWEEFQTNFIDTMK